MEILENLRQKWNISQKINVLKNGLTLRAISLIGKVAKSVGESLKHFPSPPALLL